MSVPTQPLARSGPETRPARRPGAPATPPRPPGGPRRASSAWLLPPWTRAPLLAFRSPAALLAVLGATLILACASSSPALFLSSASSEALRRIAAADCPDATYPSVQTSLSLTLGTIAPTDDRQVRAAMTGAGLAAPYLVAHTEGSTTVARGNRRTPAVVFFRPGALDNVPVLQRRPGSGIWIPETAAQAFGVAPGGWLTFGARRTRFPVVGVYRDLWRDSTRPYWCSYTSVYRTVQDFAPPPLVLATDLATYNAVQRAAEFGTSAAWVSPIDPSSLTLSAAQTIVDRQAAAYRAFGTSPPPSGDDEFQPTSPSQLPAFAERAKLIRGGLRGPVVPIALGGTLLALLLVGAAGSYWADRRSAEIRLLSARGVGPGALAGKAVLELALPAVAGTVLGWLAARWLIGLLGPSPHLDRAAPGQAALTAAGALAAGLALLALVAGLRARAATERPVGARRSRLAAVPWEVALLAAAAACYLRLRGGPVVVLVRGVPQVNLLVVAFPLLFLAGGGLLAARLLVLALPAALRLAARRSPAWYLASRRVAASRLLAVTLLAAAATPIATMVYAAGLTQTSQYTLDAKAQLYVGATVEVESLQPVHRTVQTDAVGTLVTRYLYGKLGGRRGSTYGGVDVQVLAVDPDTFAGTAFWDRRFADRPLPALLDLLRRPTADGRVPAVLMPGRDLDGRPGDRFDVPLGTSTAKLTVAATTRLFPGRRQDGPMLVVSGQRLGQVDPHAGSRTELWSRQHDPVPAQAAITAQNARLFDESDLSSVFDVANFVGISWTFGYLTALAALVGLVAVGGLLLYLEARQRSRVASYALGRRMGLTRGSHLRSLLAELGTLLAAAYLVGTALAAAAVLLVYHRLDVDRARPPTPLLTVPTVAIAGAAAGVLLVSLLASLYAQRAADRTNVAEVLRLGS